MTYEGPLDLLLDEVRRQNVAVEQVEMAPMVARFLDYVRSAKDRNLNLDIEWLHMAATLIHWKSKALLPGEFRQQDPIRDEVVRMLLTYRKSLADDLERRRAAEETRFSRWHPQLIQRDSSGGEEPRYITVFDLIRQARELAAWAAEFRDRSRNIPELLGIEPDEVTVAEMIECVRNLFAADACELDGMALLESQPTSTRRAALFLGILEMARDGEISLEQTEGFGPLSLRHSTSIAV